jgi:hypothetical protein
MYVWRNIGARSYNQSCGGNAIIFIYCEAVFVDLGTQHVMRMRHIVVCGFTSCCKILLVIL